MPLSGQYADYVLEQLQRVAPVSARRMFGGMGIYADGRFFAILHADVLYLKVNDDNRGDFEAVGMQPFKPYANRPMTMQYYELPAAVLEDEEQLAAWVSKSLQAAAGGETRKVAKPRRSRSKSD